MKTKTKQFILYKLLPIGIIYHIILGILLFIYKTPYATFENNVLHLNGILKLGTYIDSSLLYNLFFIFPFIAFPSAIILHLYKTYRLDTFLWKIIFKQSLILSTISIIFWWFCEFILHLPQFNLSPNFISAWLLSLPFSMIRIVPMFFIILLEAFLIEVVKKIKQRYRIYKYLQK